MDNRPEKKCEWQECFSKEAKEENSFDCTHDWYDGRLCECDRIGKEEECSHFELPQKED